MCAIPLIVRLGTFARFGEVKILPKRLHFLFQKGTFGVLQVCILGVFLGIFRVFEPDKTPNISPKVPVMCLLPSGSDL